MRLAFTFLLLLGSALAQQMTSAPNPVSTNGAPASATNPVPVQESVGNAAASATNPVPVQESVGNAAASATNPVPVQNNSTLPGRSGVIPVLVLVSPPVLPLPVSQNPLLFKSAMQSFCFQNLSGCAPGVGR